MKKIIWFALIFAIFICYQHSAFAERPNAYDANRTEMQTVRIAMQMVDDKTLTARVNEALARDKAFSTSGVEADAQNGVVTLTGTVTSQSDIDRAVQIVRRIDGVQDVDSKLKVMPKKANPPSEATDGNKREDPTAGGNSPTPNNDVKVSDSVINKDIQAQLKADQTLSPEQVTVEVTNGDVIVRGNVNDKAEESRIITMIQSTKGVKEVHSMLVLSSPGQ
jgi:hyperosmotically inducible periplasmic protein